MESELTKALKKAEEEYDKEAADALAETLPKIPDGEVVAISVIGQNQGPESESDSESKE